jgi:hypothetical protein
MQHQQGSTKRNNFKIIFKHGNINVMALQMIAFSALAVQIRPILACYHHVILPLQNSGVSKKSGESLPLLENDDSENEAILSLCSTTTREIARREAAEGETASVEDKLREDDFDCCNSQVDELTVSILRSRVLVLHPSDNSSSTVSRASSTSKALSILRSKRYS